MVVFLFTRKRNYSFFHDVSRALNFGAPFMNIIIIIIKLLYQVLIGIGIIYFLDIITLKTVLNKTYFYK